MDEIIVAEQKNIFTARSNEAALIGSVLRDGAMYEQLREIVKVDQFSWNCYAWCWEAFESLWKQKLGIDTFTLMDELARDGKLDGFMVFQDGTTVMNKWTGMAAITQLREIGSPRHALTYAENVQDYAAKREIIQFLSKGSVHAHNGRRAKDIIKDLSTSFAKIELYGSQDEHTVSIRDGVSNAYDYIDRASKGKLIGIKTGLVQLDRLLGTLRGGDLLIAAGRPKMGKSGLLTCIADHAAKEQKKSVAIFSLEMSTLSVSMRLISLEAKVNLFRMLEGRIRDDEWPRITNAIEIVGALSIMVNDLPAINVNQISQTCRKLKFTKGLDLVIVDYIQLAEGDDEYERRDLEVGSISRGLKKLAKELDVPVIAASQLSRAVEMRADKRPLLSDLRESGSIEQDADAVMFIYRPEYYKSGERPGEADIIVAAHRNGPVGTAEVQFNEETVAFRNLYKDEPKEIRS